MHRIITLITLLLRCIGWGTEGHWWRRRRCWCWWCQQTCQWWPNNHPGLIRHLSTCLSSYFIHSVTHVPVPSAARRVVASFMLAVST